MSGTTTPTKHLNPKSKGKNTLVASKTMSIEDIQLELRKAIRLNHPHDVIYLARKNDEAIKKEIKSCNINIIKLIVHATYYIQDQTTGKITYEIAEEKGTKEFLAVVDNVLEKLIKLDPFTNPLVLQGKQAIDAGDKRVGENGIVWIYVLQKAIKSNKLENVIDILVNNIKLISQYCKSDNRFQKRLYINKLYDSIKIKDDRGSNIFHVLDSYESINENEIKLLELLTDSNNATDSIYKVKNNKDETAYAIATKK